MPRTKLDPLCRRRVAQACASCKGHKEKCSGGVPCQQCASRHREEACQYTTARDPDTTRSRPLLREARGSCIHNESENHHALCALDDLAPSQTLKDGDNTVLTSAPVPKSSRMLRDSKGKFSMSYCNSESVVEAVNVC
jgi:hypothetical protein